MKRVPISKGLRFDILNRDGFRCRYCGADAQMAQLHIDHRTPVALGGTNEIWNLVTACADCNLGKRTKLANLDDDLPWEGIECPFEGGWPSEIEDPVYFINDTWAITNYGLERLKLPYVVPIDGLEACHPNPGYEHLSNWLIHLSTKTWCARKFDDTIEAVARALRHFDLRPRFDWAASIQEANKRAAEVVEAQELWRLRLWEFGGARHGEPSLIEEWAS